MKTKKLSAMQVAIQDMKKSNIPSYVIKHKSLILSQPRLTTRVGLLGLSY